MNINIKYFGQIAEITKMDENRLSINVGDTVGELVNTMETKFPQLVSMSYKIAVNQNMVDYTESLEDGDEVAFLPPFAGG